MQKLITILILLGLSSCASIPNQESKPSEFDVSQAPACKVRLLNGYHLNRRTGKRTPFNKAPAPDDFLKTLHQFIAKTCESNDTLYGVNSQSRDAFAYLSSELGISSKSSRKHRCAAMFDLVRVSAAFESDYNWQEGRDSGASNFDLYTRESGIFQTSPNSHYASPGRWNYLDKLVAKEGVGLVGQGSAENLKWNILMKNESKKDTIIEHYIFMLRHNFRHYGPVVDRQNRVGVNLSKKCIAEIQATL